MLRQRAFSSKPKYRTSSHFWGFPGHVTAEPNIVTMAQRRFRPVSSELLPQLLARADEVIE